MKPQQIAALLVTTLLAVCAQAQVTTSFTGGHLDPEIEQVRNLAQNSKFCSLASLKYDGFGVCITGSPSMIQAEVKCDNATPVAITLEDPYYYFCPPAKLFRSNLGNSTVSEAHKEAWDALQISARVMNMSPYELFRTELIQTLNAVGLTLKETQVNDIRSDLYGADFFATFERK